MSRIAKPMKKIVAGIILFCLVVSTTSFVSQPSQVFIQFRISTVVDSEAAAAVDSKMKSKSGVIESRTDYITSTYFCILSADADYTKEDFEAWFGKMGYTISCYSRGLQNTDPMVSPHVLKNCVEETGN